MDRPRLAGGPWLAWLSVELLGRLPSGLIRPLPVDIGRFRYRRSGFVARRSAEDLPPFRAPEQAVRDTALSLKRRSRNLRPARNPNVYASFVAIGDPIRRGPAQSGAFPRFYFGASRRPTCPDPGPPKCTTHDLRHTFASGGLLVGEGLPMIGKLLGHTQVQTTARYAHLANDPIKSAANRIASRISNPLLPH